MGWIGRAFMPMTCRDRWRRREDCDQLNRAAQLRITRRRESDSVACVNESADPLPTDIAALHAMVAAAHVERDAAVAQRDAALAQRDEALSQNDRLRHLLRQLQRAQFGQRSEKLDPEQFAL